MKLMKPGSNVIGTISVVLAVGRACSVAGAAPAPHGWPESVKKVMYRASSDGSRQPMLMYTAEGTEKRPLLVGLHTWSGTYEQAGGEAVYARWCIENNWHFIHSLFIESFYEKQALPAGTARAAADPLYGKKQVIFRKISGNTRVTMFEGRHEIIHQAALNWLANQRKGTPAC